MNLTKKYYVKCQIDLGDVKITKKGEKCIQVHIKNTILFKINEAFRSFLHSQVKIVKEKCYIKTRYNVKINQICTTLAYLRNTISKKMCNLNFKLVIETRFKFCYMIGLKNLSFVLLTYCRCNHLSVSCMTEVLNKY